MSCTCNENRIELDDCQPHASIASVNNAFMELLSSDCCVAKFDTVAINPITNPVVATAQFNNRNCCDTLYAIDENLKYIYMSANNGESYEFVGTIQCVGELTTVGLTPDALPLDSVNEAFPNGIPNNCGIVVIKRNDNQYCFSIDKGVSFYCPTSSQVAHFQSLPSTSFSQIDDVNYTNVNWYGATLLINNNEGVVDEINSSGIDLVLNSTANYEFDIHIQGQGAYDTVDGASSFLIQLYNKTKNTVLGFTHTVSSVQNDNDLHNPSGILFYKGLIESGDELNLRVRTKDVRNGAGSGAGNVRIVTGKIRKL